MGIDLAAQPKETAVCLLAWDGGGGPRLVSLRRGESESGTTFHDKWLATTAAGIQNEYEVPITKVGIDDPFGWPVPFLDAMESYRSAPVWPTTIDESRDLFRLRETDRVVHARTGRWPLSVTADRIAIPAMRCAVLLSYIAQHHGADAVARDGSGRCCEVYPDPALRFWTDGVLGQRESYKKAINAPRRIALLEAMIERLPIDDPENHLAAIEREDDYLDALACALVARAAEVGQTHLPEGDQARLAQTEGWIHLPCRPVRELATD